MLVQAEAYHAHVYFDSAQTESARALNARARHDLVGSAVVHDLREQPVGPHTLPMFEIEFTHDHRPAVLAWLTDHHGPHSVLIHPVTGDDLADHQGQLAWLGEPQPLNLEGL